MAKVSYAIAGAKAAEGRLREAGPKLTQTAVDAVTRLTLELEAYVKNDKLSGQVLHVRTGNLRNSVNSQFETVRGQFTGRVGTGIVYARIHEFGGVIDRFAKPGVVRLRENAAGQLIRQGTEGRLANLAVFAKARHKRFREVQTAPGGYGTDDFGNQFPMGREYTITMPERSFLRSALADRREAILAGIRAAVRGALA